MHTIQSVAEKTGLTPDVIRIWERRYNVVAPERTPSNQRLYSDDDIERLSLLRRVTEQGRRISAVAALSNEELRDITVSATPSSRPAANLAVNQTIAEAIDAIIELNPVRLEQTLQQAFVSMGSVGFMLHFLYPLMEQVGELWRSGAIRTCQEHFSSAHVRSFLGRFMLEANTDAHGPRIIVATLPGQLHELGATMSAVVAAQSGWNVIYLGAAVPLEEILFCAEDKVARAVAISLGYPMDDPSIPLQLEQLGRSMPTQSRLIVGGSSAARYTATLAQIGALQVDSLSNLSGVLDSLR
ncbi:MerR family transcriptional regulator [Ketobacter sp.]|uniref:MerR family transcriptional regulator n=1 Tax=Ketobacter sp. TaxID=2083498 RepID=UPI000F1AEF33|nr:MerR family transcriptional regulator [Ketobacter sp.]RLU01627.1 MAG: MerR family transcriptional regulator [Ketobacter sp.]